MVVCKKKKKKASQESGNIGLESSSSYWSKCVTQKNEDLIQVSYTNV